MKKVSLYIHIPFCESKCYYCDFLSFKKNNTAIKKYIDSVIVELSLYSEKLKDYKIDTIFIGGGTPSCIEPIHIYNILKYIHEKFDTSELRETTIEVNPGSLDLEKVNLYKDAGIKRVSMGMQSFNGDILKSIGRIHGVNDFYSSYKLLIDAGINNINVDLILGLPGQKEKDITDDLKILADLNIKHVSYYGLILEDNTRMKKMYLENQITLPSEDLERKMYHGAVEFLKTKGYIHYEISNFALSGYECKHNMSYWKIEPYIGIGLGSHSNIDHRRYWNEDDISKYNRKLDRELLPIDDEEFIDLKTEISEYAIMGLRLIEGINLMEFENRYKLKFKDLYNKVIDKHMKNGLLRENKNNIFLTKKGLDLSNIVEVDFLLE